MRRENRTILSVVWVIIGVTLIGLSFAGKVDEFWNGMGFALAVVGCLQLLRHHRFNKNESYREAVEIAETDERNHFIRMKTWSWTGYIVILTAAVAIIVFRVMGQELLSLVASYAVCFMLVVYWIVYTVLNRKY
jgi:hypothetical protein